VFQKTEVTKVAIGTAGLIYGVVPPQLYLAINGDDNFQLPWWLITSFDGHDSFFTVFILIMFLKFLGAFYCKSHLFNVTSMHCVDSEVRLD